MPLSIFPSPSDNSVLLSTISRRPSKLASIIQFEQSSTSQRAALEDREMNRWPGGVGMDVTDAGRETVEAFLSARDYSVESFLFKDPLYNTRGPDLSVALTGDVNGSNTEFTLPTTGRYAGDYPIDDIANTIIDVDGSPVTVSSIDVDARSFTLAVAPTGGQVVTADKWTFYLRVALILGNEPAWGYVGFNQQEARLEIEEVVE